MTSEAEEAIKNVLCPICSKIKKDAKTK